MGEKLVGKEKKRIVSLAVQQSCNLYEAFLFDYFLSKQKKLTTPLSKQFTRKTP